MHESLRGRLLVATPTLLDPNFVRTVVLLLEHTADGAVGVVMNRPSETPLGEILPAWHDLGAAPAVVYVGGPVQPDGAIGLARPEGAAGDDATGFVELWPGLGTVDLERAPGDVRPTVAEIRVFAGYAGWGPRQLEGELEAGSWFVVDLDLSEVWSPAPERLWTTVLRRQPGRIAQFANCPLDPSTN